METSRLVEHVTGLVGNSTTNKLDSLSILRESSSAPIQDDGRKAGTLNAILSMVGRRPNNVKVLRKALEQLKREGANLDVCAALATGMWLRWFNDAEFSVGQQLVVYTHLDPALVKAAVQDVVRGIRAAQAGDVGRLLEDGLLRVQADQSQRLEDVAAGRLEERVEAAAMEALVWNKLAIVLFEEKEFVRRALSDCEAELHKLTVGSAEGFV